MRKQNTFFYKRLLNEFTKTGKKASSKKNLDSVFLDLSKQLKLPPHLLLIKLF